MLIRKGCNLPCDCLMMTILMAPKEKMSFPVSVLLYLMMRSLGELILEKPAENLSKAKAEYLS